MYQITVDFYVYDEILNTITFRLYTASLKIILNNLLNHQINIMDFMLNNIY